MSTIRTCLAAAVVAMAASAGPNMAAEAQSNRCLGYHPSTGYFNLCTPEGAALKRRLDAQTYGGRRSYGGGGHYGGGTNDPCLGYHPTTGYFNKCSPEGQAILRRYGDGPYGTGARWGGGGTNPCLRYAPGRGYYIQC